jgi:hypothetical protein
VAEILLEILQVVFFFFAELFLQVGLDILAELFGESLSRSSPEQGRAHPVLVCFGLLLIGAGIGALWAWLRPKHLVGHPALRLLLFALGPVLLGLFMHHFGKYRRSRGARTTTLATFWGGAALAVGIALLRYLMT